MAWAKLDFALLLHWKCQASRAARTFSEVFCLQMFSKTIFLYYLHGHLRTFFFWKGVLGAVIYLQEGIIKGKFSRDYLKLQCLFLMLQKDLIGLK